MNRNHLVFTGSFLALLLSVVLLSPAVGVAQHGFSVKQYEEFHEVLHPLEHDALPKKDFRRIRGKSSLLLSSTHGM